MLCVCSANIWHWTLATPDIFTTESLPLYCKYVPCTKNEPFLAPSFKSSLCVSLSLSLDTLLLCPPFLTMYCTVHNRYGTSLDHSHPLSHPLHHTTTMWKLPPAPSFDEIPSRGLFCDKEVMRNTSGTAPVFPNVELKSADSMFLALILYLSWQEKMDQWNGLVLWPPRTLMIRKRIQPCNVQDEHDCLCAAFSSLRNISLYWHQYHSHGY